MAFEAYSVAIKLSLINHVSSGLLMISKGLQGAGQDADKLHSKIKSIGAQMATGGIMFAGGMGLLHMFKAPLEEAKKFETQVAKLSLYGMSDAVNREAVQFVRGMDIIGTSLTEKMRLFNEAQGVFRESGMDGSAALYGAKIASPVLAKIHFATAALDEESQAKMNTSSMAMMRYIEDSGGLKSPKRFNELADAGWRMVQTSGGSVDWEQLRQFKVRGGVAAMNMSDEAMAMMEPIITMLKGQTAGFSLRTAYNRLNGIVKIPNQVAHELVKNGVWDEKKIEWNKQGGIKMFHGNPLINSGMFSNNAVDFYEKIIMPMHKRMGHTTDDSIAQSNAMIFGSTGGAMFTLIHKNMEKLHTSLQAQHKALGVDDSYDKASKTVAGKELELQKNWANLMLLTGEVILPMAISALTTINPMLKDLAKFIDKNRIAVGYFATGLMVLSGFLITGGLINMVFAAARGFGLLAAMLGPGVLAGAFNIIMQIMKPLGMAIMFVGRALLMNPIGLAFTAIAAAVYLIWRNWDTVGPWVSAVWDGITSKFRSFVGMILSAWQAFFNGMVRVINIALPGGMKIKMSTIADDYNKPKTYYSNEARNVAPVPNKVPYLQPITVNLNADGKKLAEVVTTHQSRAAHAAPASSGKYDWLMNPVYPGMPGAMSR